MNFPDTLEPHRQNFVEAMKVRRASPRTVDIRDRAVLTFFKYLAEARLDDVREVTRQTVRDYQLWLQGRYSGATVLTYIMGLRRFFDHLEKTDVVLVNPCAGLLLPPQPNRLPKTVLTVAEAKAVLRVPDTQTPRGIRDRAILEMFYSTGLRIGELIALSVHDVDTQNGFVRVNKGKGGKDRVVPMGGTACRYVREYLREVRAKWAAENREERALWLISYEPYRPIQKQMITVMVREYGQAAGLAKPLTAHVWRHTCATHLVANDANLVYVQRLLGHKSLTTTQIYTRVAVPELRVTVKKKHPRARRAPEVPALTRANARRMPQL
jgi:integrase/recombinase XerD